MENFSVDADEIFLIRPTKTVFYSQLALNSLQDKQATGKALLFN